MNVVVRDDGGSEDCLSVLFDAGVYYFFNRNGSSEVYALDTPLLDSAVLDVDDLAHTYGVLVIAYGSANDLHVLMSFELFIEFLVGHYVRFRRYVECGKVDIEINSALQLDSGTFSFLHDLCGNNFGIYQTQFLSEFYSCSFCYTLLSREHHGEHDDSVAAPLNFRSDALACSVLSNLFKSLLYAIFRIEFVDEDDFGVILESAAADKG